jgi:hypothetical protein
MKMGKGLCASVRAMVAVRPAAFVYFEVSVTASAGVQPALGVGLSPADCPLNVMVGSWPGSLGLYMDGQLLVDSHWRPSGLAEKAGAGCTLGMLVYVPSGGHASRFEAMREAGNEEGDRPELTAAPAQEGSRASRGPETPWRYNVNGAALQILPPSAEAAESPASVRGLLYPTVSLFSEETRVWCRFCEADIIYRSRESIQAPPGVRVYCLDGSLLLDETE